MGEASRFDFCFLRNKIPLCFYLELSFTSCVSKEAHIRILSGSHWEFSSRLLWKIYIISLLSFTGQANCCSCLRGKINWKYSHNGCFHLGIEQGSVINWHHTLENQLAKITVIRAWILKESCYCHHQSQLRAAEAVLYLFHSWGDMRHKQLVNKNMKVVEGASA